MSSNSLKAMSGSIHPRQLMAEFTRVVSRPTPHSFEHLSKSLNTSAASSFSPPPPPPRVSPSDGSTPRKPSEGRDRALLSIRRFPCDLFAGARPRVVRVLPANLARCPRATSASLTMARVGVSPGCCRAWSKALRTRPCLRWVRRIGRALEYVAESGCTPNFGMTSVKRGRTISAGKARAPRISRMLRKVSLFGANPNKSWYPPPSTQDRACWSFPPLT
mmetsp:Transcript_16479/g.38151  ORF Transcript_16479/g.38151 Transcript_16479/m.38151 type:complete len:219 (+) Transcript_16479:1067-1723(+)